LLKLEYQKSCDAVLKVDTYVDLLRHGETVGGTCFRGSTNDPLTELGWRQLWEAVEQNKSSWDRIITSPLIRCSDFAKSLGQELSIPVISDRYFKEMHFGTWEGYSVNDLLEMDADALSKFWNGPVSFTPPQAEPLLDFEKRVMSGWQNILSDYSGKKILLITHGGVIRLLLCRIRQRHLQRILEIEVGHATMYRIRVEHAKECSDTEFIEINK